MSQSLSRILIHLVFSTKDRRRLLTDQIRTDLPYYLGGILAQLECPVLAINSVTDHVHVLFALPRHRAVSSVVMELKRGSSK